MPSRYSDGARSGTPLNRADSWLRATGSPRVQRTLCRGRLDGVPGEHEPGTVPGAGFERLAPHVPVPAHCATGWKAAQARAQRLPNAIIQNSVGTTLHLAAERAA
jgi:hypothetical protein